MDLVRSYPRTFAWALVIGYIELILYLRQFAP